MEEVIATHPNLTSSPSAQTQASNPSTTQLPTPPDYLDPKTRKRPLENGILQNPNYGKMRAVVEGLRPRFLEVLRTPDFRTCKASCDIQTELKVLIDICKHMKAEMIPQQESPYMMGSQLLSSENLEECKQKAKHEHYPQVVRPSETKRNQPISTLDKEHPEDSEGHGSYVVGGSAFDWNFITFRSIKNAVYYGVTKEQFRAVAGI